MRKQIGKAVKLYESFRERKPKRIGVVTMPVPKAVACIGYVDGIDYRTTHGTNPVAYHHDFAPGSRPLFAVSADGKQLILLGGRFQFTERGIVDRDAQGQEIDNAGHGQTINPREPVYKVSVWEERDRLHISIEDETGYTYADWWDDDARQMFEDGFFDRRKLQESVIAYAREMGMLVKRKPPKLKQKEVFAQIRALGLTVKRDEAGEFRVTVKGVPAKRAEELAYYTNDLQDLLSTAHAIIRHEDQLDSNRMDNPGELPSMQEQVDKANAKWQTPVALNGYDGVPVGVGDRVELHPATDLWMRGAKFGRVVRLNAGPPMSLSVKMDHPKIKRAVRFDPVNVRRIT